MTENRSWYQLFDCKCIFSAKMFLNIGSFPVKIPVAVLYIGGGGVKNSVWPYPQQKVNNITTIVEMKC